MSPFQLFGSWVRSLGPLMLILALALSACAGCETQDNGDPPKQNGSNGETENGETEPAHESARTVARIWLNAYATEEPWPPEETIAARKQAALKWVHPDAKADFEAGFADAVNESEILVVKNLKAETVSEGDGMATVKLQFDHTNWLGEEISDTTWTVQLKQIEGGEWRVVGRQ